MKIHNMKLMPKYFDYIKYGSKRIELRLNDEKRKKIKIGDKIIFQDLSDNSRFLDTRVIDLYYDNNFSSLIDKHNIELFADENISKEELLLKLNEIYSKNAQKQYGVVGIKLEILGE